MEFKNWKRKQKTKEKIEYFEKSTKFILIQYKSKKKNLSTTILQSRKHLCNHHISHKKSIILITKLLIFLFKEDKH